jgi:hypothetical protein
MLAAGGISSHQTLQHFCSSCGKNASLYVLLLHVAYFRNVTLCELLNLRDAIGFVSSIRWCCQSVGITRNFHPRQEL